MASNKDLIIEAEGLAEELGLEITTEGLKNAQLAALVSDLKAKKKETQADTAAEVEAVAEHSHPPEVEAEKKGPVIAKGKSLTSLKGILGEGEPVSPEHFVGGQKTFDDLKERGFIE